ncbi:uncharacterized protein M421DRAFT_95481 [Didymella exigua CBS 183.55]|uniref:FAD-binding FR-type domain-containing protein n=1 Tax=Didymella exigua CBS 183.55 TaxID=1150837 RepID=A0A6A5RFB1_9PLEO|nr:uncharacterized protein M421DRAFT_95481 [Didymella exigua CBS 183.55]KAF1924387.1 hypothetical protein M421DRAFT_95481 [Didymella exigua CBS 183.55]
MSVTEHDFDDVRYEYHVKHRISANQNIFWVVWTCISVFVLSRFGRKLFALWSGQRSHTNRSGLSALDKPSVWRRTLAHINAVAVQPSPQLLQRTFTELSTGKIAALATYLLIGMVLLLSVDPPTSKAHFIDDVAFRAAWITVTQIPLVLFLSTKNGLMNILASISYERVLYLHKWAGRMIFVSATTHVVIMKSSISLADILLSQDTGTTVVRYGIGSYFLLVWIAISSILPVRKWSYRAFYINHWTCMLAFLVLIIQHVPEHASTPIYMAFGFVGFDKISTLALFARNNISVRPLGSRLDKFRRGPGRAILIAGYPVEMMEPYNLNISTGMEESVTTIRICSVPLKWQPGQHIRLYAPALGAFEMHPFTPANCSSIAVPPPLPPRRNEDLERRGSVNSVASSRQSSDIILMVRARSGLTRRIKEFHTEWLTLPCPNTTLSSTTTSLTAYIDGPYGDPPSWVDYEILVLVVTSTGVSFALSILDYFEQLCLSNVSELRTRAIRFVWIVRHIDPQFEAAVAELCQRYGTILEDSGVRIETELHVTCVEAELKPSTTEIDQFAHLRPHQPRCGSGDRSLTIRNPDEIYDEWEEEERQWALMEALEEMKMKQVDPFEDANEISSVYSGEDGTVEGYEGEGYASSEIGTLLNGANNQEDRRHSNTFSSVRLTVDETAALNLSRPLSSPVRSRLLPGRHELEQKPCECALIQYQRGKLQKPGRPIFDRCSYGRRPDTSYIITSALNSDQHSRSIVAVCANSVVSRHARKAVSEANTAFARGLRATDVEIFIEEFS